jgi:hypothetical protein
MTGTNRGIFAKSVAALGVLAVVCASAQAASISYPNQGPIAPGFTFTNIVESSVTDGLPLYGSPTAFPIGLSFSPAGFGAGSSGGGVDLTDGQLNYTVKADQGAPGISQIKFSEGGLFTLTGVGTADTQVQAGANLAVTVLEINGAPVAPILLAPSMASVAYNLVANSGVDQAWTISVTVNVASQLAGLGYLPSQRATKADVVVDNALVAVSQLQSGASISKADFNTHISPEPGSLALLSLASCGCQAVAGRRRRR